MMRTAGGVNSMTDKPFNWGREFKYPQRIGPYPEIEDDALERGERMRKIEERRMRKLEEAERAEVWDSDE